MVCHGLHDYGGHEYMYTKGILDNLPDDYNCIIWARKDINANIKRELNAQPIFSKVEYNQEQNFFIKCYKLIIREFLWYKQIKKELEAINKKSQTVIFVHTFSLYNVWSWLRLIPKLQKKKIKLLLLFRYSKILLPSYIQNIFIALCKKFPRPSSDIVYLTDSKELANEYLKSSNMQLIPLPVMAKTKFKMQETKKFNMNGLNISYLGCARNDKGFFHIPRILEKLISHDMTNNLTFLIQASLPGTDYLENKCRLALNKIQKIKNENEHLNIKLFNEQLSEDDYEKLLVQSNLILLPYTGPSYKVQTSGILIEAMSNGIPCIVPKNTWMSEEIKNTGGGCLFDPEDEDDIADSVIKVIKNHKEYYEKAQNGISYAQHNHGPVAQTERLVKIIDNVK